MVSAANLQCRWSCPLLLITTASWSLTLTLLSISNASIPLVSAWTPPPYSLTSLLFPVRNTVVTSISQSDQPRQDLAEAGQFFVEAFWTAKVGGGARQLSPMQRQQLQQSQTAEFTKRYGRSNSRGRRKGERAELLLLRNADGQMIACAGVQMDRIPKRSPSASSLSSSSWRWPFSSHKDDYDDDDNRSSSSSANDFVVAPLMSNLAVSRDYRRRGVAEQMVRAVEQLVQSSDEWNVIDDSSSSNKKQQQQQQQRSCFLYVEERNRAAVALYEKLGYRRVWRNTQATTLLPTVYGDLQSADTVIVCMKKTLSSMIWPLRLF
jgi:GNAT superfamily N-acetyltransferase